MKLTRQEQKIEELKQRLSTARTKEILLLTQLIETKEKLKQYEEKPSE